MVTVYAILSIFALVLVIYGGSVVLSRREERSRIRRSQRRRLRRGRHEDKP